MCAVIFAGGCGLLQGHDGRSARIVHEEGEGPLAMLAGEGGKAIYAPPRVNKWWATSGWAHPCVEGVAEATITAVRYEAAPKPLRINTLFMFTPPLRDRSKDWAGQFGESYGVYPDFNGMPGDPANGGHASRDLPVTVKVPCSAHPAPEDGWVEMLTEVQVGRQGTHVEVTHVDYEAEGKEYTLEYRWETVLCGDAPAVTETGLCTRND